MKATELRIGNFIETYRIGGFFKEHQIATGFEIDDYDGESLDVVRPIPLTEEWLERFGFEKVEFDGNYWFEKKAGAFDLITNDIGENAFSTKLDYVFVSEMDNPRIKNVHTLQNLYFALTGEELELKK